MSGVYNPLDYGARRYDIFSRRAPSGAIKSKVRRNVRPSRRVETKERRRYDTVRTPSTNGTRSRETICREMDTSDQFICILAPPALGPHYSKLAVEVCPICPRPTRNPSACPPGQTRDELWNSERAVGLSRDGGH